MNGQKITTFLWFDKNAEEAMKFYADVFNGNPKKKKESKILRIDRYEGGMEAPFTQEMLGKVITGIFELEGQQLMCLDGGDIFKLSPAVSLYVDCEDQEEVDYFWGKMSAVPEAEQCGWIQDKFGLSWQIIPRRLEELASDTDKKKSHAVVNAMLKMKKIVVADLEKAYEEA